MNEPYVTSASASPTTVEARPRSGREKGSPPAAPAPEAAQPPHDETIRQGVAAWLRVRGVGPKELVTFAAAFAATAAFVFLLGHPGLGAVLGVIAILLGELSLVPPAADRKEPFALAAVLNPLVDLVTVAGVVGCAAARQPPIVLVLGLLVFVLFAWLPLLKAMAGPARIAASAGLWRRADRMAVLLLGAMLGRLGPGLFALLVVGVLDAWLRVEHVVHPAGAYARLEPGLAQKLIRPDGTFVPALRWGTLAFTVALFFVLPQSDLWRF